MPNYLQHDPASTPVAGRVLRFFKSLSEDKAAALTNMLQVAADYTGQSLTGLKVVDGEVLPLTQADIDAIAAQAVIDAAASAAALDAFIRTEAKDWIQAKLDSNGLILRALALTVLDEINTLRSAHGLGARTAAQLRNAIHAKIDDKTADGL